ncbi:SSD domain-containing protein [Aphelenchoides fujianensis]|nr:SSD domain-containing protein [Aphelenchoides fujianensis]
MFTLLFLWPAVGMLWLNVKDNIRDGYTPRNAQSRHELNVLLDFYNTTGEPRMTVVLLTAKDGGSMLRLDHMEEAQLPMNNFEVRLDDGEPFAYYQLCEPTCNINRPLEVFYQGIQNEWETFTRGYPPNHATKLTYPVALINGYKIPLQRLFYGINTKGAQHHGPLDRRSLPSA